MSLALFFVEEHLTFLKTTSTCIQTADEDGTVWILLMDKTKSWDICKLACLITLYLKCAVCNIGESSIIPLVHSKSLKFSANLRKQKYRNQTNKGPYKATIINISKIVIRELSLLQKWYKNFVLYQ